MISYGNQKSRRVERKNKRRDIKANDLVVGYRIGDRNHGMVGRLVEQYYTKNGHYMNPAYVIEDESEKRIRFQSIKKMVEGMTMTFGWGGVSGTEVDRRMLKDGKWIKIMKEEE